MPEEDGLGTTFSRLKLLERTRDGMSASGDPVSVGEQCISKVGLGARED